MLVTQSDLEAKLGRSLTSQEASAFTSINSAVQSYIEDMIGSSVELQSEATRYYDGGVQHLPIDPCYEITAVKLYDDDQSVVDTYDTTDYTKDPINQTLKTMIRYRAGKFATGISNIGITAKFSIYGDSNALAMVKQAILDLVGIILSNPTDKVREAIEGYSVDKINLTTLVNSYKDMPSLSAIRSKFVRII